MLVPYRSLLTHMFATGMTGSGKTTTIVAVLAQLRQERGVPWVVLKPTKSEYRQLLHEGGPVCEWRRLARPFELSYVTLRSLARRWLARS